MFTAAFWRDTAERVIATAAQAALGVLGTDAFDLVEFDWRAGALTIGIAAAASLLKALVAGTGVIGDQGDASLVSSGRHAR